MSEVHLVYEGNTGDPVPFGRTTKSLNIVLPACKIPHEIPDIHMPYLVAEEIFQVLSEGWFIKDLCFSVRTCSRNRDSLPCPVLVERFMSFPCSAPHPWEKCGETFVINRDSSSPVIDNNVFS